MPSLPELLIRPDLGKRPYRLRCRFTIDAFPKPHWLEKAKYAAAEAFVRDMAKQGFEYVDRLGVTMTGPFPTVEIASSLRRPREHFSARRPDFRRKEPGSMATTLPALTEMPRWDYELAMVFVHKTLLVEIPTAEEEREMLNG